MKDFRFQGKVYAGMRNADGTPGTLAWLGDVPKLQIKLATDKDERQESYSGQSLTSVNSTKAKKATFDLTLNYFSKEVLALALFATVVDVSSGSVTGEALPTGVAAGDVIRLDYRDVTVLTLTGADGTTPLVLGTDYSIESAPGGLIKVIDPTHFNDGTGTPASAATADYTYAASIRVPAFTADAPERYLVFDGKNTVTGETVRIEIPRAQFDPISALDVISDALSQVDVTGALLYDSVNAADANFGGFARISQAPDV